MVNIQTLVAVVKAAAVEAADHQERFAADDTEARKIVDTMERFLRIKARVVYGGAAVNAHLPASKKFYDPSLYLPDYDFMTPDPLQDCADLITAFQNEGFTEIEAKFGIHEGTYKVFVNFRAAADITYMPRDIYEQIMIDSTAIDGIHYASVNYLRMNIYLELSRPAGMVSRWEKVYERLLLLNEEYPIRPGRCMKEPLKALASTESSAITENIIAIGIEAGVIFLSGASMLTTPTDIHSEIVLIMTDRKEDILSKVHLKQSRFDAIGEIIPSRTELYDDTTLVAVLFDTVACHNYTTLESPKGYRLGSIDLLIQMYYAMYFTNLQHYVPVRLLCVIQELIDLETTRRRAAAKGKLRPSEVFPLTCVGHQPSMPELKKAHRTRVAEKRKDLVKALKMQESFRVTRRRTRR